MQTEMKLHKVVAVFLLLPLIGLSHKEDTLKKGDHIIEISSQLTIKGIPTGDYEVFISLDGVPIDTLKIEKSKQIYFDLEKNKLYALVYRKKDFPDKIVMVDTNIPTDIRKDHYYNADFQVELHNAVTTQKEEYMEFPVASFKYDKKQQKFLYSDKYNKLVHSK